MFTIQHVDDIHARLGKMATFPEYIRALKKIGVERYDSYVTDGHSEYFGPSGQKVVSVPTHVQLSIADSSNRETFLIHLKLHEQGETSYVEMSQGLAESGIQKWTVNTGEATMTYYDKMGNEMLVERVEQPYLKAKKR